MTFEEIRVWLWVARKYPIYKYQCWKTREDKAKLNILSSEDTIRIIIKNKLSVCRLGDGELQMISHLISGGEDHNFDVDTFQDYDPLLASRLRDILFASSNLEPYESRDNGSPLVCLPYQLKDSRISTIKAQLFWDREWLFRRKFLLNHCSKGYFGDSSFTRFYLSRQDIVDYPTYVNILKKIWNRRKIIMIEGEYSRLGWKNDLFDNAICINRILCPATNAYRVYDRILNTVKTTINQCEDDPIFLIALGHTATVLAYDLSLLGCQAIDLGHVDIEYEWYKMKATKKVPVPNKYVNEVRAGRINSVSEQDKAFEKEVIARITL